MKEKDLYVDYKPQQLIYYVEKEDASYGPLLSGSYISKHYLHDYYEKMDQLAIGRVTNMLEIIESMQKAQKVITI